MNNREYLDTLLVCGKIDSSIFDKYSETLGNSELDLKNIIRVIVNDKSLSSRIDYPFIEIERFIEALNGDVELGDKLLLEVCKVYREYKEFGIDVHSDWFYFNMIINTLTAMLGRDFNLRKELVYMRILDNINVAKFTIKNKTYTIKKPQFVFDTSKYSIYDENGDTIEEGILGVALYDDKIRVLRTYSDIVRVRDSDYKFVLICDVEDETIKQEIEHGITINL